MRVLRSYKLGRYWLRLGHKYYISKQNQVNHHHPAVLSTAIGEAFICKQRRQSRVNITLHSATTDSMRSKRQKNFLLSARPNFHHIRILSLLPSMWEMQIVV